MPSWRPGLLRSALHRTANTFFHTFAQRTVTGLENVPERGPVLLVFNHLSNFDPHLIFASLPRRDAVGIVTSRYRANPVTRFLVERTGGFWLDRGSFHPSAIKHAIRLLSDGWLVGISPEGRRSPHSRLVEGMPGPAFMAIRTDVPVLPVAVTGTEDLLDHIVGLGRARFERGPVTVRFGLPFTLSGFHERSPASTASRAARRRAAYRIATTEIMCRIAALLPPEYRGVYRHHGRVTELRPDAANDLVDRACALPGARGSQ